MQFILYGPAGAGTVIVQSTLVRFEQMVDNLTTLDDLTEQTILDNLEQRYKRDEIYTGVGAILLALNPFKALSVFSHSILESYLQYKEEAPPHVYRAASLAYQQLQENRKDQTFLISGESGAGKTETTKFIMQFFSTAAGSETGVEQEILHSNPVLEALGNATTTRNNNSSRFGKYITIQFGKNGKIEGAFTTEYLLEKSRVVQPGPKERSYHIFYQLLVGADADTKAELKLSSADAYRTLNMGGLTEVAGVEDHENWNATLRGMRNLKFKAEYITDMNRILAAILHMGNVVFEKKGDGVKVEGVNSQHAATAADCLMVSDAALIDALCMRHVTVRNQTTKSPYTLEQAEEARDALSKALYAQLFKDVVIQINKAIACKDARPRATIGILDIFGFEIFQANSLEQLFINYANEKLHQIFNSFVFKQEQKDYEAEGIPVEKIGFRDNKDVLDLIEAKKGLLDLLNDEVGVPKGSDENYLLKASQEHKKNEKFSTNRKNRTQFIVHHFAGDVTYETSGFLEKNRDKLPEAIRSLLADSKVSIVPAMFAEEADANKARKTPPLAKQFALSLKALSDAINKCEPHFVRCIKPNQSKLPNDFQSDVTIEQLRNCGVLETVQIRALGFPNRLAHKEFFHKYSCTVDKKLLSTACTVQELVPCYAMLLLYYAILCYTDMLSQELVPCYAMLLLYYATLCSTNTLSGGQLEKPSTGCTVKKLVLHYTILCYSMLCYANIVSRPVGKDIN
eukprot:g38895.t1